jgi:hypothetical protein
MEDDLPSSKEVHASYVKQQMIVEYGNNAISMDEIIAAVKKAIKPYPLRILVWKQIGDLRAA